jgi:Fe-S-cluster containining protein
MTIHFECTMCGKCCHDLKLPLSVDEAIAWLERGTDIQILCEAVPWPEEPPADNLQAQYKRGQSFPASSGELPTRIMVILAAAFTGPCPNLGPDMRCGIYEERPRVCRIYPAEINPFVPLMPEQKQCPPEAWTPDRPVFAVNQQIVDATTMALIQQSRDANCADTTAKALACAYLDIKVAALANEGFAIFSPHREAALSALRRARDAAALAQDVPSWTIVSNRAATVDTLNSIGALSVFPPVNEPTPFEYLGFFPATT